MVDLVSPELYSRRLASHWLSRHFRASRSFPVGLDVLGLLALSLFLFCYGLTASDLWRTESLRAILAAECLRSGNWIVPTLYGEPLLTKPPGMYVAIAAISWPFGGVSDWSARLPSVLAAMGTVFLFYWYFRRQMGRLGGLVAAGILPASFMWLDKVPSAEIDMLQVFWVSAAILFFLRALEGEEDAVRAEPAHPRRAAKQEAWWLAALLCVAGGVLTKWTAPAFFYGTAIPLLWWRGCLRLLVSRRHLLSAALAATICLTWVAAVVVQVGWGPFYEAVSRQALMHLSLVHNPRPHPWAQRLAHPLGILAASLPWSAVALLTLRPGFAQLWDERGRRLLQALHCWTWPNLVLWSLIAEPSGRHSFPLCPGLSGLAALVWLAWLTGRLRWPIRRVSVGHLLLGTLAVWLVVKLAYVQAIVPARNHQREPRAKAEQLAALIPEGQTLYLFRLKDEGIMFYYGRTVKRLAGLEQLPSSGELLYCIVTDVEWQQWPPRRPANVVLRLKDQQSDPIVLLRVGPL